MRYGVALLALVLTACATEPSVHVHRCQVWVYDDHGHAACLDREQFQRWRQRNGL